MSSTRQRTDVFPSVAGGRNPRQFTVLIDDPSTGGVPDPAYPVGIFEVSGGADSEPILVAAIAVADLEGRLLIAIPQAAWHRTTARRALPSRALAKATSVEVPFEDRVERSRDPGNFKLWLGFLAPEFESALNFETPSEESVLDITFVEGQPFVLPAAQALVEIALQQGPFETATSGAEAAGAPGLDKRLQQLEQSVAQLVEQFKNVATPAAVPAASTARPSALRKGLQGQKPKSVPKPCPAQQVRFLPEAGLDPDVLRSAREAGIPEAHISQMAALAAKGKPKLTDAPLPPRRPAKKNVLSESEDEEEELVEATEPESASEVTLTTAVSKLTQIAEHLVNRKKKEKGLEAVLDGIGSGSSESSGLAGPRRHSAALRALQKALVTQPEEIVKSIEGRMQEDFNLRGQVPGSAAVQLTARSWLEMRSRVQNFQTPVRLLWAIGGVLDALNQQRISEAKARCCLALAAGDQLSIDRGSWLVAGELMLEEAPPLASFAQHSLPMAHEAPYTRLVDGRWLDLVVQKLADYDTLSEKKKRLGGQLLKPPGLDPAAESPAPKPKAKVKGKGKEKGSGGAAGTEPAASSQ